MYVTSQLYLTFVSEGDQENQTDVVICYWSNNFFSKFRGKNKTKTWALSRKFHMKSDKNIVNKEKP